MEARRKRKSRYLTKPGHLQKEFSMSKIAVEGITGEGTSGIGCVCLKVI